MKNRKIIKQIEKKKYLSEKKKKDWFFPTTKKILLPATTATTTTTATTATTGVYTSATSVCINNKPTQPILYNCTYIAAVQQPT